MLGDEIDEFLYHDGLFDLKALLFKLRPIGVCCGCRCNSQAQQEGLDSVLEGFMSSAGSVFDIGAPSAKPRKSFHGSSDEPGTPDAHVCGVALSSEQERLARFVYSVMVDNYVPGREFKRVLC